LRKKTDDFAKNQGLKRDDRKGEHWRVGRDKPIGFAKFCGEEDQNSLKKKKGKAPHWAGYFKGERSKQRSSSAHRNNSFSRKKGHQKSRSMEKRRGKIRADAT